VSGAVVIGCVVGQAGSGEGVAPETTIK